MFIIHLYMYNASFYVKDLHIGSEVYMPAHTTPIPIYMFLNER